jgi:hypothetical protein
LATVCKVLLIETLVKSSTTAHGLRPYLIRALLLHLHCVELDLAWLLLLLWLVHLESIYIEQFGSVVIPNGLLLGCLLLLESALVQPLKHIGWLLLRCLELLLLVLALEHVWRGGPTRQVKSTKNVIALALLLGAWTIRLHEPESVHWLLLLWGEALLRHVILLSEILHRLSHLRLLIHKTELVWSLTLELLLGKLLLLLIVHKREPLWLLLLVSHLHTTEKILLLIHKVKGILWVLLGLLWLRWTK